MKYTPDQAASYINALITRKAKLEAFNHFKTVHGDKFANDMKRKLNRKGK